MESPDFSGYWLEHHLDRHLPVAGIAGRSGDASEGSVGGGGVRGIEIRFVPRIVGVGAELCLEGFADGEVLHDGEIPTVLAIAADAAEAERGLAVVAGELLVGVAVEAGIDVEPAIDVALRGGERDVLNVADEDGVAEAERASGLDCHHCADLPAAGKEVDGLGHSAGEPAAAADGDFVDAAAGNAVRAVKGTDAFVGAQVGFIEEFEGSITFDQV